MVAVLAFIQAFLASVPGMIALGVNLMPLIGNVKDAIEALSSGNHITDAQRAALDVQVAAAESAWAVQVAKAQAELNS